MPAVPINSPCFLTGIWLSNSFPGYSFRLRHAADSKFGLFAAAATPKETNCHKKLPILSTREQEAGLEIACWSPGFQ